MYARCHATVVHTLPKQQRKQRLKVTKTKQKNGRKKMNKLMPRARSFSSSSFPLWLFSILFLSRKIQATHFQYGCCASVFHFPLAKHKFRLLHKHSKYLWAIKYTRVRDTHQTKKNGRGQEEEWVGVSEKRLEALRTYKPTEAPFCKNVDIMEITTKQEARILARWMKEEEEVKNTAYKGHFVHWTAHLKIISSNVARENSIDSEKMRARFSFLFLF